ncbi:MAG: hypothetical protein GX201_12950 [Clostridiales bacterium]|nr:hypothetical protein [Clostridiales bacterium]
MKVYKGNRKSMMMAGLSLLCFIGLILLIFFFTKRGFLAWAFMFFLFIMCVPAYNGMIVSISIDEKKVVIRRPLSWQKINLSQAAFCAVHDIGEGKSLLFVFVRQKWRKGHGIKGIKSDMSYEEVLDALSKGGRVKDIKVNFNKAIKVPVAMVENGDELKERILDSIDAHHLKAVYS